jgi:hypothetical protein
VVRELSAVSDAAGAGDGAEDGVNPLVAQLHHVETADNSKPVIDANTHVAQWDKGSYLNSIALGARESKERCQLLTAQQTALRASPAHTTSHCP